MLRLMTRLFLIAASFGLLASCQTLQKLTEHKPDKDDKKPEPGQVMIGKIDMINPDQHFVLIRTLANMMIEPGTELVSTNSQGQTGKLKVTPEHKGSFLAADIVSGSPQKQDMVMFKATSTAPPALSGEKPVRGDVTDIQTTSLPSPAPTPYQPSPATAPAPSEFLRPIPPQPPLPTQQPQ